METVWVGRVSERSLKKTLQAIFCQLLVGVIPIAILLAALAYGIAVVSQQLTETRTVRLPNAITFTSTN